VPVCPSETCVRPTCVKKASGGQEKEADTKKETPPGKNNESIINQFLYHLFEDEKIDGDDVDADDDDLDLTTHGL
jgi:hypothetical protein